MGTQGYRANYREAFECANHQLEAIYSEYHGLQQRKEQLESAVAALGPFLKSARVAAREEFHLTEPVRFEATADLDPIPQPVLRPVVAVDPVVPVPVAAGPAVAPSYAPVSEANIDPIQDRINRALGLAVA